MSTRSKSLNSSNPSLSKDVSRKDLRSKFVIQSLQNSPNGSQKDLSQFYLPQIPQANKSIQGSSTKIKQQQFVNEDEHNNSYNHSYMINGGYREVNNNSNYTFVKDRSKNDISIIKEDLSTAKQKYMNHINNKIHHRRNISQQNISNASTLNISHNNSKISTNDFSIMLTDIQNSQLIKNSLNNSHLSSTILKHMNSSIILSKKNEKQQQNIEAEIQQYISMQNNNTNTDSTSKFNTEESSILENNVVNTLRTQDSVCDKDQKLQQKKENQTVQKLQTRLMQMENLKLQYKKILTEIMVDTKKSNLYAILNQIIEISDKFANSPEFSIDNYCLFADICRDIGDFNKSVLMVHHARLLSSMNELYKKVAEILSESGQNQQAIVYLKKMLRLAWKLREEDAEIDAYDLIGKNLVQIGEVDLGEFFHQKCMSNDKEPIHSPLRISGEIGVKIKLGSQLTNDVHDYKSDNEDDLDLQSFPKSKQDENIIRNELLGSKKSNQFSLPKILLNYGKRFQSLGRLNDASIYRGDIEVKVPYRLSHLSLNRDLKNYYIYAYKNQNFWIKDGDINQQQKYYILKKNYSKYKQGINLLVQQLKPLQVKCFNEIKTLINIDQNDSNILNCITLQS